MDTYLNLDSMPKANVRSENRGTEIKRLIYYYLQRGTGFRTIIRIRANQEKTNTGIKPFR